jgi:biopolymer transport protein TolR
MNNSRRRRAGRDLPMNAEINVTSLIDVAFTLLVIFIITAPMLQGGLEVQLPRGQIQPITAQDDPFIVAVDESGVVYVGETPVSAEEFASSFPQLFRAAGAQTIYVKGDEAAIYGDMFGVLAIVARTAQEEGVRWALVGEPEPRR